MAGFFCMFMMTLALGGLVSGYLNELDQKEG